MRTIIHVNRNVIQRNSKRGEREPVCRVQQGRSVRYAMRVRIEGPSELIYSPDKPLPSGARLWIETESPVVLLNIPESV
jgi:hypothetical protein